MIPPPAAAAIGSPATKEIKGMIVTNHRQRSRCSATPLAWQPQVVG